MTTKTEIVAQIAKQLGVSPPPMSSGSTEPKEIFVLIDEVLGLQIGPSSAKQKLAKEIVEATGNKWKISYESAGATVTKEGLLAVLSAVEFLTN